MSYRFVYYTDPFSRCLLQTAQSDKELCDLYRYFQTSYYKEVEDHKKLKCQMAVKEQKLLATLADQKATKEAKMKADDALTKTVLDHSLVLFNKDNKIRILREELDDAKRFQDQAVSEYRKSVDFVFHLGNCWAAAMRCARHAIPDSGPRSRRLMDIGIMKSPSRMRSLTTGSLRPTLQMPTPVPILKTTKGRMLGRMSMLLKILPSLWLLRTIQRAKRPMSRI